MEGINVVHNPERKRFEVKIDGRLAVCEYIMTSTRIIFTHTEVPKGLEGKGIGTALAKTAMEYARANSLKIMPLCPYIASYMRRHPEHQDMLVAGVKI